MKNLILKFTMLAASLFVLSTMFAAALTGVTGWDFEATRLAVAGGLSIASVPAGALGLLSSQTITDFVEEFGAYYQPRGQNAARLRKLLMDDDGVFWDQFTTMPLEGDRLEYGLMDHTRVLQPFKAKWSPTGQMSGKPRVHTLRRVKVNIESIPDHLVNTWLGFLATEGGRDPNVNRATWPFVRWYVEMYLIPQAKQDMFDAAFYGLYVAPGNDNDPEPYHTSFDGIHAEVNRDIDAGLTTAISTGALETDPELFVEQIEDFADQIDRRYRGMPLRINMHDSFAQRFKTGLIEMGMLTPNEIRATPLYTLPKRTNITIVGQHNWLTEDGGVPSEKLICAMPGTLVKGVRVGNKEDATLRIEQVDYTLKMFNDWHILVGNLEPRVLAVNDRELDYGVPE